jgi:hypothetical protein
MTSINGSNYPAAEWRFYLHVLVLVQQNLTCLTRLTSMTMSEVWTTLKLPSVELPPRHIYLFTQSSSNEYQIFTCWWPFKDPNMFWNSFSKNTRQFYLDSWYNHNIVLTYDALLININLPILLNATYHRIVNMYTNSFKELYVVVTDTDCWYQLFEQNTFSHWHINNYKPMWRNDGNLHW